MPQPAVCPYTWKDLLLVCTMETWHLLRAFKPPMIPSTKTGNSVLRNKWYISKDALSSSFLKWPENREQQIHGTCQPSFLDKLQHPSTHSRQWNTSLTGSWISQGLWKGDMANFKGTVRSLYWCTWINIVPGTLWTQPFIKIHFLLLVLTFFSNSY